MIYFDKVSKVYGDSTSALDEVTLHIGPREFLSIVGHSGAGKTTLLKMLIAEERPSQGGVFFESSDVHRLRRKDISKYRRRLGTIFQDFKLLGNRTAYENVAFAMEAAGKSDEDIARDVPQVLDVVDLTERAWHFPHQLSGGERQRVAIARAIVNRPDVLLADEPTGNLDPKNTNDIIEILRRVNDLGTTVILTTHNPGVVNTLRRRVITLDKGKIVRDDKEGTYHG